MLLLMQGRIFLKGTVSILPIVIELTKLLLRTSLHTVYVAWNKVVNIYELVSH